MAKLQSTPPTAEPISLNEAKLHLRQDGAGDDVLIPSIIRAARDAAERFLRRQLVTATWQLKVDAWPAVDFELPRPPLASITSITYVDADGTTQTLAASYYDALADEEPGRVIRGYLDTWPTVRGHAEDVTVTFVAGYATPFTVVADTDVLTWAGRTPTDAEIVRLSNSGGASAALPAALAVDTDYHVLDSDGSTCKLAAAAGGDAIDVTDTGTGTHFIGVVPEAIRAGIKLMIGHLYEHREAVVMGGSPVELPLAVKSLWWPYRVLEIA